MSKLCLFCENVNNDDAEFCTSCGKKLESKVIAKYDKDNDIIYITIKKPDDSKIDFTISSNEAPFVICGPLSNSRYLSDVIKNSEVNIVSNEAAVFWEKVYNRIQEYDYKHASYLIGKRKIDITAKFDDECNEDYENKSLEELTLIKKLLPKFATDLCNIGNGKGEFHIEFHVNIRSDDDWKDA